MDNQKKSVIVRFPVILLAVSAILLSASPCAALIEVTGETTLDVDYPINEDVAVDDGGILNLLDGGVINGGVGIGDGGVLNMEGGYISGDVCITGGSEVNIKGGGIGGDVLWDIVVEAEAKVTVFGTDFSVTNGTIDSSGTYFTADKDYSICNLKGKYGGVAGPIDLVFYIYSSYTHVFLAAPVPEVIPELLIDIRPGSEQNNINLKSKGVVQVAILTTNSICAEMIDLGTVEFAGAEPVHWSYEDIDDDGNDDIIFHFRIQELVLDQNSTEATLKAELLTGEKVTGTDDVRMVPSKKK